jgi:protein-S-isoprenylcysteine O-methyltransferase Ste14
MDAMLHTASRGLGDFWREMKTLFAGLDATERMVVVCLVVIGVFYVLLGYFQRGSSGNDSTVRFAGLMFASVVLLAGAGWMVSAGAA